MRGNNLDHIYACLGQKQIPLYGNPGAGWLNQSVVNNGPLHEGEEMPSWFQPTDTQYLTGVWTGGTAWWVIHAGEGHVLDNTRVNVSPLYLYALRPSGWEQLNPSFEYLNWEDANAADVRIESDGTRSYQFQPSLARMHGSTARLDILNNDYIAIYARTVMQLVLDNPVGSDDRNTSLITGIMGGDWWPTKTTPSSALTPAISPGIGNSAAMKLSKEPTAIHFLTVDPALNNAGYPTPIRTITKENFLKKLPFNISKYNVAVKSLYKRRRNS